MNDKDFENYVEKVFIDEGYTTEQTPYQDDGADIFIYKNQKKTVVQVKFHENNRSVNKQMIRELHGTKDLFECDHAILATDGVVMENALKVAKILNIEIRKISTDSTFRTNKESTDPFAIFWEKHIMPLKGTVISNDRISNKIIDVTWQYIERVSSEGNEGKIDIEIFRSTVNHLFNYSIITRKQINDEYRKLGSSGVILVLSQVEGFELIKNPSGLKFNKKKYVS